MLIRDYGLGHLGGLYSSENKQNRLPLFLDIWAADFEPEVDFVSGRGVNDVLVPAQLFGAQGDACPFRAVPD
jgi:hypothetical protein